MAKLPRPRDVTDEEMQEIIEKVIEGFRDFGMERYSVKCTVLSANVVAEHLKNAKDFPCSPGVVKTVAEKLGYDVSTSQGFHVIRVPRKLDTVYQVYVLADIHAADDEPYPDQVLRTLTVPYVNGEVLTVFDTYRSLEEAQAAVIKESRMFGEQHPEFVILPVSRPSFDWDKIGRM